MSTDTPKRRILAQIADVARALANPHRLELLEQLGQGPRAVETVAGRVGLSVANASQHLQQLRRCGLVVSRRDGKRVLYSLADGPVVEAVGALGRLAERNLAEVRETVRTYFASLDGLEPVSRQELAMRLKDGGVTLLDVRPEDEFKAGHLPGALNVPLDELERRLSELPPDREVVAYCRGPYCLLSFEAVAALRARGFRVRRLEDGYPEWRAAGLDVVAA